MISNDNSEYRKGKGKSAFHNRANQSTNRLKKVNSLKPEHQESSPYDEKIVQFLKSHPGPQETLSIARGIGLNIPRKKTVNPSLYNLKNKGVLQLTSQQPPLWALSPVAMQHKHSGHHYSHSTGNQEEFNPYLQPANHHFFQGRTFGSVRLEYNGMSYNRNYPGYPHLPSFHRGHQRFLNPNNGLHHRNNIQHHRHKQHNKSAASHNDLFKNTRYDKNAPGAYRGQSQNKFSPVNGEQGSEAAAYNNSVEAISTSSDTNVVNATPTSDAEKRHSDSSLGDSESDEDILQSRISDVMKDLPNPWADYKNCDSSDSEGFDDLDFNDLDASDNRFFEDEMNENWNGSEEITHYSAESVGGAGEQSSANGTQSAWVNQSDEYRITASHSPRLSRADAKPPSPAQLLQCNIRSDRDVHFNDKTLQRNFSSSEVPISNLMPWLNVSMSHKDTSFTSRDSSLQQETTPPLTYGQKLLREGKTCEEGMEYLVLSDETSEIKSEPEQLQQRRPPLLNTPLVRGSNPNPPMFIPAVGNKISIQPISQLQPYTNNQQNQIQIQSLQPKLQITAESFAALNKNPISAFMEYAQSRHLAASIDPVQQHGPSHKPVFVYAAKLGNRVFPYISSSNKKDGKKEAAEQAIRILIAEGQYHLPQQISVMKMPESSMTDHDKIAAKVHQTYNQLIATVPESFPGRKVIAGIVMQVDSLDSAEVVSIGSGNRCITGDKLSQEGNTVNDCHAEIITRRGLMSFLWDQVIAYPLNKEGTILEPSQFTGKLAVKSNVKFHLYISTAPCGDGALFSPRDAKSNNVPLADDGSKHCPVYSNNAHGVLRTKMEGGEGTIPIEANYKEQAWDGLITGERLRTMSCSDKICRWNVLGMQGALLSHFLDPIYLDSVTLGYLYDHSHLSRAVCCRLDRGDPSINELLPRPFRLNHPVLGRVTACDPPRETQKTKSYSVNWRLGEDRPEILDGSLGICYSALESKMFSRLSKKNMFDKYKKACAGHKRYDLMKGSTYYAMKRMSTVFLQAKETMFKKFRSTGCGKWISKPQEEEMFS